MNTKHNVYFMITGFKVHIRDQDRISLETIDGGKHLAIIKEYYLECVSNCVYSNACIYFKHVVSISHDTE